MGFFKVDSDTPLADCDIRMKFRMKEGSESLEITGTTSDLGEEKDKEISELKEKIEEQRRTIENLKILIASKGGSDERDQ